MPETKALPFSLDRYEAPARELVRRAFVFAAAAHEGQMRGTGDPYISHPTEVARELYAWGLDERVVAAGLLHDVVEDTEISLQQIEEEFGLEIAALVDGVTKLSQLHMPQAEAVSVRLEASNENLRKLLLASIRDIRVLLIKLADRVHNLRTLGGLPEIKRHRIARESLEVYAPLADRLGMGRLKAEIEDRSFRYYLPQDYARVTSLMNRHMKSTERYLIRLRHELSGLMDEGGVEVRRVEARRKHFYSVYKKLAKVDGDIDKLYDLVAVRLIVPNEAACYQALGLVHQRFRPLIYRIKDYIAVPKPNGYRSLHTTVFALDGRITEIQIRTPQMHEEAENGLAAHFFYDAHKATAAYKEGKGTSVRPQGLAWVEQLASLAQLTQNGSEFVEGAKLDLFSDRIFVYSPRGDLYDLPEGATPVDFAFAVHTDIGLRTMGAKVNGRIVTLDYPLENRDVVEILTRREAAPNRDWLGFVRTAAARQRIKAWYRAQSRDANTASGRALLEAELKLVEARRIDDLPERQTKAALEALKLRSWEEVYAALGEGSLSLSQVLRRLFPEPAPQKNPVPAARPASISTGRVLVAGTLLPYSLAACCAPVFPDVLTGYLTRGKGVTVHRNDCRNLPDEPERYLECAWEVSPKASGQMIVLVEIVAENRIGLLRDITNTFAARQLNIHGIASRDIDSESSQIEVSVEVPDLYELSRLIRGIEALPGTRRVRRIASGSA